MSPSDTPNQVLLIAHQGYEVLRESDDLIINKESTGWWNIIMGFPGFILMPLMGILGIATGIWLSIQIVRLQNPTWITSLVPLFLALWLIGFGFVFLTWGWLTVLRAYFSGTCRLTPLAGNCWLLQRRLGRVPLPSVTLSAPHRVVVVAHLRRNAAYSIRLHGARKWLCVVIPTTIGSKSKAMNVGRVVAEPIAAHLGVEVELQGWE